MKSNTYSNRWNNVSSLRDEEGGSYLISTDAFGCYVPTGRYVSNVLVTQHCLTIIMA